MISNFCIKDFSLQNKTKLFTCVNPTNYFYIEGIKNSFFKIYSDGIFLTLLYNLRYKKTIYRNSMDDTSIMPVLFNYSKINNLSIFFVGCNSSQIMKSVNSITRKYNLKNISGYSSGYHELPYLVDVVQNKKFDIIIAGLGSPKQEEFLVTLSDVINHPFIGITCGGYLYQSFYSKKYYSDKVDRMNVRWLIRALRHSHVRKKLIIDYPKFLFHWFSK